MGFLAPWFLGGLAALGLPVYLHLLRRHANTPQPFSSLMFFERRTQSSVQHRRLRYLLLFALRMALLFFLVLAFANPFVNRSAASMSSETLEVLVIDNSFSMRAGARLADAKSAAESVLGDRKPLDRAQVMALGSQVHVLTQPVQDAGTLRAAVESVQPSDSRASFGELARAMRSLADTVHTPITLHLFSDLQRSGMPPSFTEMALPPNIALVLHQVVGKDAVPNWTVESVNAPGQVWDTKKARIEAVISGYHTQAATRTVSLEVNGKATQTKTVMVPANGRATVDFQGLDVPYGFTKCAVKIDSADGLPADDSSLFAVQRSDPQRVLFVHEGNDSRSPLYFRTALDAAAEAAFNVDVVNVDQAANSDPSRYAFVVVSDVLSLPQSFENSLLAYTRKGGSVLVAIGNSAAHRAHIPVFDQNIQDTHNYAREPEGFLSVGDSDPSHPSIAKADHWAGVRFYFAVRVPPAGARVVAKLTDQTPLLLEKTIGEGRVLLLTSGLDNVTNDFPLHPAFVPFIEQTALYLSGTANRTGSSVVDSFLELRTAKEQAVGVEVVDPEGKRPLSPREATTAQSYQLTEAGFYQLRLANGRQDLVGVNPDRHESDLDVMPDDIQSLWRGKGDPGSQQAAAATAGSQTPDESKKPYSLWWYAMLALLIATVAETLISSRYLGTQREEP